eukprot:12928007-Prorocentrum_lima.AAC.1
MPESGMNSQFQRVTAHHCQIPSRFGRDCPVKPQFVKITVKRSLNSAGSQQNLTVIGRNA